MHGRTGQPHGDDGATLIELLLALALLGLLTGLAAPVTAHSIDGARAREAAGFMSVRIRLARQQAVFQSRSIGIVFDLVGHRWTFRLCQDGNRNGVRRADITSGTDPCPEGPVDLSQMFPGVDISVDPALPGPEGDPATSDPVKFGLSNIASFAPEGTGTAGTLFLRSKKGGQYAVRVGNITGRTRVLRYDPGSKKWVAV